ncbi:hypothetical protein JYG30_14110 [Fibrella sp. USSR17]
MEKQPVDDLFARKLREAEAPVSPDVYNQLQHRLGAKPLPVRRRPVGMWWYVGCAASVVTVIWFLIATEKSEEQISESLTKKQLPAKTELNAKVETKPTARTVTSLPHTNGGVTDSKVSRVAATYPDYEEDKQVNKRRAVEDAPIMARKSTEQATGIKPLEIQQPTDKPVLAAAPTAAISVDQISTRKKAVERTIVLTIAEPQVERTLALTREETTADPKAHANGLTGLFGKLKQLKNGEVMANASSATDQPSQKTRFGRVFNEVKESLKNETTLE